MTLRNKETIAQRELGMSGDGSDLTGIVAKELAAKLPVEKVLSPAAGETGLILLNLVKTIHLALAPFQFLAAYQDRLNSFLDTAVRCVPEEKRIPPAPQILGPIIEGIRYEPEGTPIDQMFSRLLSCSMEKGRVEEAHPAYPLIIRQLSADEAKILARLKERSFDHVHTKTYDARTAIFSVESVIEVDELPRDGLSFPGNISFYFDHLSQLGLAGIYQIGNQEPIFGEEPRVQTGIRARSRYTLTGFGEKFVKACIGN
jgi:hypothetical protein